MSENNDRIEKEVYEVIGGVSDYVPDQIPDDNKNRTPWWVWAIIGLVALATIIFLVVHFMGTSYKESTYKESTHPMRAAHADPDIWYNNSDAVLPSCATVSDTLIDSIHLKIITPYNTVPELHMGTLDTNDADLICAALAADLGYDHGRIIGAFVCEGKPISWGGGRKLGYCAIIDGNITLGVAENSPLFEEATENEGYFFRQYPAVDNGVMVENNPKNASFRRTLCMLDGKVCIVATDDRVLMNDFSSALVKLGVDNAIFLIGGTADGWYRTEDGTFCRLGYKVSKDNPNINYIVFRAQ